MIGRPVLPLPLGQAITILDLGKIKVDNQNYHTDKYIWPVSLASYQVGVDLVIRCGGQSVTGLTERRWATSAGDNMPAL